MEYEALFPKEEGRYFPKRILHPAFREYNFSSKPTAGETYLMAVDWSKTRDRTQILVGKAHGMEKVSLVNWREIDPQEELMTRDMQIDLTKSVFKLFNPAWFICDTTGAQDLFINLLTTGIDPIPLSRIHCMNKDKEVYGFEFSGPANYELMRNYKKAIESGNFVLPKGKTQEDAEFHDKFRTKWITEHHELESRTAQKGGYIVYKKPENGYDDLVQCSAMLCWYIRFSKPSKPLMKITRFGKTRKIPIKQQLRMDARKSYR